MPDTTNDQKKIGRYVSDEEREGFLKAYNEAMKSLPTPETIFDIPTQYGKVRVYYFVQEEHADLEPLVLLHDRAAASPMWAPNLEGLIAKRPVYAIDLLGSPGMSEQAEPIENNDDQAAWLAEVLEKLDIPRAHLVGAACGGWLAMNLARLRDERVASVSLLDPVLVFARVSFKVFLQSLPFMPSSVREKAMSLLIAKDTVEDHDLVVRMIEHGVSSFQSQVPFPKRLKNEELEEINVPVMALMAEDSGMQHAESAVTNARYYLSGLEIDQWKTAGHAISLQYPWQVNVRILDFVKQHAELAAVQG